MFTRKSFQDVAAKKLQVTFAVFKFTRNEYVPTVLKFKQNIYSGMTNFDIFGIQEVRNKYITPVPEWPVKVNVSTVQQQNSALDKAVSGNISSARLFV